MATASSLTHAKLHAFPSLNRPSLNTQGDHLSRRNSTSITSRSLLLNSDIHGQKLSSRLKTAIRNNPAVPFAKITCKVEQDGKELPSTVDGPLSINNITEKVKSGISEAAKVLHKPTVVAGLLCALMFANPDFAFAATSGGRVGGRAFSGGGSSYSAPSRSYSAPSQTYISPSFSTPYFAPSPFFGGWSPFGFGPTVVVGGGGFGFGGLFNFLLLGVVVMFVANAVTGFLDGGDDGIYVGEKTSVVRLQVGLLGLAKSLQKDLERIADRADTSDSEGLHYILTETVLALLRHPDYCVYGFSTSEVLKNMEDGEAAFNRLSLEERGKFEQETLVNVGSVQRRVSKAPKVDRFSSEYIVVTLLVATEGKLKLPNVNNTSDLREALSILGSVPVDQLQAVEILWTPQNEDDTLSSQELLTDYPSLRAL